MMVVPSRICGGGPEHWKLWSGYPNSGRSPDEVSRHGNADDLPSAVDPAAPKENGKSKGKGNSEGGNRKKAGRPE